MPSGGEVYYNGLIAGADLSGNQYKAVRMGTSGATKGRVLAMSNANAQRPIGVQLDDAKAGQHILVQLSGPGHMEAAGAITVGNTISINNAGEAIAESEIRTSALTDLHVIGMALEDAVDGQIFRVMLQAPYLGAAE